MKFSAELARLDCAVALERLGGDEELLREVAGLFLEEYPLLLDSIRESASRGDADGLQRAAHSMKGSVSNFGADAVYQAAFTLEQMGRSGDLSALEASVATLEAALEHIHPALLALAHD